MCFLFYFFTLALCLLYLAYPIRTLLLHLLFILGLEQAFENISLNIGKNWRVLASELKIPECYVDETKEKYPSNLQQQALKILQIWKKHNEETATLDTLKRALEARLCKRKGVGVHMLKPVISVD